MSSSAVASSQATASGRSAGPPAAPHSPRWWQVTWSVPAAIRALRATIVLPLLFALTDRVIRDPQMTLFAVFGGFATLIVTTFAGTRRDKAIAHLGLALAGTVVISVGTLAGTAGWLAVLLTIPVAFATYFAGSAGPNAAAGVTGTLFAFVLPLASAAPVSVLPSRLAGWWLASAAGTAAVLLVAPRPAGDRLRAQTGALAALLAGQLNAAISGLPEAADATAATAAKHDLLNAFDATPYRPIGLAAADQGLASLIHLLEWCASLIADATDGHIDLTVAAAADRTLLAVSADTLRRVAAVMAGERGETSLDAVWQARLDSAAHLHDVTGDPASAVREADAAYHAQAIGVAVSAAFGDALVAARQATPAQIAEQRRNWVANLPVAQRDGPEPGGADAERITIPGTPARASAAISADASLRSVWFRNSARGAIALAAAVAVARITDVQHAFWIVLGTLSVLRTSAAATGATALRALAGTAAGFVIGAVLLLGIGTSPLALWVAFPVAILVAAYTPGTAPFAAGQAAFTITIVVLFNLLAPAGWVVGLLRVEDVAIGCAVSLVVGYLFWPRGVSAVVGDNLADAFRRGSDYLSDAARWALGESPTRPQRAVAALAAGYRLDDAVRGYLTEQGSKRVSKQDLWMLLMAALRLRLTAHSMASLPLRTDPHADDSGLHTALEEQLAGLADFYQRLADLVSRPGTRHAGPGAAGAAGQQHQRRFATALRRRLGLPVRRPVGRAPPRPSGKSRRRPAWPGHPARRGAAQAVVALAMPVLALRPGRPRWSRPGRGGSPGWGSSDRTAATATTTGRRAGRAVGGGSGGGRRGVRADRELLGPPLRYRFADDPVDLGRVVRSPAPAAGRPARRARPGARGSARPLDSSASRSSRATSASIVAWVASANGRLDKPPPPPPRNDRAAFGVADRPEGLGEPELADHLRRQVGRRGQVVGGAGRALAELHQLGGAAAEPHGQGVVQVVLAVQVALDQRQLLGDAERLPGRQDRDLRHRIGVLGQRGHEGVPGLVHGDGVLLLGQQDVRALPASEQDPVPGVVEVGGGQDLAVARGPRRWRPRWPGWPGRRRRTPGCRGRPRSGRRRAPSFLSRQCTVRIAARSSSVGSGIVTCRSNRPGRSSAGSRTSGRLVAPSTTIPEVMSKPSISDSSWLSVCSRSSLATTAPEPARRCPIASISSTKMIAGARLASLGEQVANPGGANADEHLHEAGAGDREERHRGLAGHRPGQQRLAGAGRSDHQHAPRGHRAGPLVPLGIAQEVDDLGDFVLGAFVAGHIGEAWCSAARRRRPSPASARRPSRPAANCRSCGPSGGTGTARCRTAAPRRSAAPAGCRRRNWKRHRRWC